MPAGGAQRLSILWLAAVAGCAVPRLSSTPDEAPLAVEFRGPGLLFEVRYPGGATFTLRDPYSFPPTLGELDSHLAAEGRHERLWERLGAHPAHHRGTSEGPLPAFSHSVNIGQVPSSTGRIQAFIAATCKHPPL